MEYLEGFLAKRKSEGTLRKLPALDSRCPGAVVHHGTKYVDFSSNDYLGLSNHPKIVEAARQALETYGVGTGASRLMSGDLQLHHALEEETASFKGKESALVFNSGYQANTGIIPAFVGRNDAVFADRLCHASQLDGVAISKARLIRFQHNDMEHLAGLLERERSKFERALILTESVFGMDGDLAPLSAMVELKDHYNCILMVDEAHATGVFGHQGRGLVDAQGLSDHVELIMGTFSKALGGFGAYLAASRTVCDYLVNSARSFIYSTSLPAAIIAADLAAIEVCKAEPDRGRVLLERAEKFRKTIAGIGWSVAGASQIVPVMVGGSIEAVQFADELLRRNLRALPIRPPTVPDGTARLRLSLCYEHTDDDLAAAEEAFRELR
ncbi:MAG: 8-amino-7-oxononanoate synthase [Armatimonadota bacterium]